MNGIEITEMSAQGRSYPRYRNGYTSPTHREYQSKPRMYFHIEGESLLENFGNRFNRPSQLYRQFIPQVLAHFGLPAGTKVVWSQKAGCSCGCSPGFIVQLDQYSASKLVFDSGNLVEYTTVDGKMKKVPAKAARNLDIWVTVKGEEAKATGDVEKTLQGINRVGQLLSDPTIVGALQATKTVIQSGRSGAGNLRNFKSMSDEKFEAVIAAVRSEDNDPEAIAAVNEEYVRRNF